MTSRDQDRGHRGKGEVPPDAQAAGDETGESSRLSDSIVGLFDRLREAAASHDGE
jgi:hypothetical protein